MSSRFPHQMVTYKDTQGKGMIAVREYTLTCDEDGFIEAPANMAAELEPHGFIKQDKPKKGAGKPAGK